MLRVGEVTAPLKVWITCRHHACEMMASYVLEGIIDETVADFDAGTWLRRNVDFLIVPMVDKDGVESGDQGKNRQPHDHAADYVGPSLYPEVAALRAKVRAWAARRRRSRASWPISRRSIRWICYGGILAPTPRSTPGSRASGGCARFPTSGAAARP